MDSAGFRTLCVPPAGLSPSARRINRLLSTIDGDRYLEIGVDWGFTIESVEARVKVGVDPFHGVNSARLPPCTRLIARTSDDFFSLAQMREERFDLAFVDGLHRFEQAYRDVINAFAVLEPHGVVIMDDTIPSHGMAAIRDMKASEDIQRELGLPTFEWMGDVFRAVLALERLHPELGLATFVDDEHRGQTLVWRRQAGATVALRSQEDLAPFERITFHEAFSDGLPVTFSPMSFDAACAIAATLRRVG